ncbi:LamG domain-containing protein [Hymenobacter sp. BT188]|uniref:LamG domain-containing protein n=1 Tax=Hymenobacter sp. BT188 TaxID=2763504 RepID=UPI001651595F|nr:LamG domain-containing protein [Hymenobacter sp. BT188]MBC6606122.1 LamG domain-containing protein [Hymenobacter sp. BT188]
MSTAILYIRRAIKWLAGLPLLLDLRCRPAQLVLGIIVLLLPVYTSSAQNLSGSGNKLTFNGLNTHINCGTSNRGITQRVTVEAWIRTTSSGNQWVASKHLNSLTEKKGFHLYTTNGQLYFNGYTSGGISVSSGASTTRVNDGRWHHVVGVCNLNTWQVYVDGVLENNATYPFLTADLATSSALAIGVYIVQSENLFVGDIDEVRVWRTALTQDQIRANMCRKISPVPDELVAYYSFDQRVGAVAIDKGSDPTNGRLINFNNDAWQPSGAAIGDASTYAYGPDLRTRRLGLAASNGDSAIVTNITTQTNGVQLYAVNEKPSEGPTEGTSADVYFGVFSRGNSGTYDFRLRPANGLSGSTIYTRPANDGMWSATTATPTPISLLLVQQRYRAEYMQANVPLPVELTAFSARRTGPLTVALAWQTASEQNSADFTVEQAPDGHTFSSLGSVAGQGTSSRPHAYTFTAYPAPHAAYYRLVQRDVDGTLAYSPVVFVGAADDAPAVALQLVPNPAHDQVRLPELGPTATLQLVDGLGRLVRTGTGALLSLRGITPGLYMLQAARPGHPPRTARLLVE